MTELSLYALDGVCHNAEPGTYGHECGKPAKFLGTAANGATSGFCADCQKWGYEAKGRTNWRSAGNPWRVEQWSDVTGAYLGWRVVRDRPDLKWRAVEVPDGGEFRASGGPIVGHPLRTAAQTLAVDLNRKELMP